MPDSMEGIQASIAIGTLWTDDDRLIDAEALLRSVHSAAALVEDRETERAATLALARCLLWRGRIDEAGAVVAPLLSNAAPACAWALAARIRLASGGGTRRHAASRARVRGNIEVRRMPPCRVAQR
jgi:hypothetical protein